MRLHPNFLLIPIAHRGLHNQAAGIPECSPAAFQAAIDKGYGIELDVQESLDGKAMVFHDPDLSRMTGRKGKVREETAQNLSRIRLKGGTDTIPTLDEVLALVKGRVPVLVEIKDQDGNLGPNIGHLSADVARAVSAYNGPIAVMSYNAHAVSAVVKDCGNVPVGLVTSGIDDSVYSNLTEGQRKSAVEMAEIPRIGASFISHNHKDLNSPHVANARRLGLNVLSWTIRNKFEEKEARKLSENITFEDYLA